MNRPPEALARSQAVWASHGDGRAEVDALRISGENRQGQEWIVLRLARPDGVEAERLGRLCEVGDLVDRIRGDADVELHR